MFRQARATARTLVRQVRPRPAILLYHRVATPRFDPWDLAIAPEAFDQQIAWLKRHRIPLPLDAFVEALTRGTLPRRAVAVTFDDGYLDNLVAAQPILRAHAVPATLFLATGFAVHGTRYWWDVLADALFDSPDGADWTFDIGGVRIPCRWRADQPADPGWRAWQPPAGPREQAFITLWARLQRVDEATRRSAMEDVVRRFPVSPDPDARAMRSEEVRQLVTAGFFQLGAHSETHPALTSLTPALLDEELRRSRDACASLAGQDVALFAYPYGDTNPAVQAAVARAGFVCAFGTEPRTLHCSDAATARWALPRIVPPSTGARDLARMLPQI